MFNVRSKYVILPTSPNKTAKVKSGFRLQLLYYARSVAKHCDWNQAPGCQRETPQIEGKTPQIEEKSSFRLNCLTLSRQAITYEPVHEKTNNLSSDQVGHKPGCSVTEDG